MEGLLLQRSHSSITAQNIKKKKKARGQKIKLSYVLKLFTLLNVQRTVYLHILWCLIHPWTRSSDQRQTPVEAHEKKNEKFRLQDISQSSIKPQLLNCRQALLFLQILNQNHRRLHQQEYFLEILRVAVILLLPVLSTLLKKKKSVYQNTTKA